ncbi:hypothetical protein FOA52_001446 [Chlamydomonas sp. UWO 241]|nr:hypothetical protein FOA52_001446 [Chlamydomonas sp. UWO 241]
MDKTQKLKRRAPAERPAPATKKQRMTVCEICLSDHARKDMVYAGSDAASSSSSSAARGCDHPFCLECMRQYVCTCVDSGKHSVPCPSPRCKQNVASQDVIKLLRHSPAHTKRYTQLEVESSIPPSKRIYCPHKDCSTLLMKPAKKSAGRTTCPVCERTLCCKCLIPGWHEDFSCEAFQALPLHQRSAEDAALFNLSAVLHWKQCPSCSYMVERSVGCNHMTCRCGTAFCYKCGLKCSSIGCKCG